PLVTLETVLMLTPAARATSVMVTLRDELGIGTGSPSSARSRLRPRAPDLVIARSYPGASHGGRCGEVLRRQPPLLDPPLGDRGGNISGCRRRETGGEPVEQTSSRRVAGTVGGGDLVALLGLDEHGGIGPFRPESLQDAAAPGEPLRARSAEEEPVLAGGDHHHPNPLGDEFIGQGDQILFRVDRPALQRG